MTRLAQCASVIILATFAFSTIARADDPVAVAAGARPCQMPPSFLKPGVRLVYKVGLAILPSSEYKTITDANGPLVDPTTGGHYILREENNQTTAGEGYDVIDIAGLTSVDAVAMYMQQFTILGPLTDSPKLSQGVADSPGGVRSLASSFIKCADPAALNAIHEETHGVVRTGFRSDYKVGDKTYKAINIVVKTDQLVLARVYDLETGICLHAGTTVQGSDAHVAGDPGARNGGTSIMLQDLVEIRTLQTPWSGTAIPQQLAGVKSITYQGTAVTGRMQTPVLMQLTFHDATDSFLPFAESIRRNSGAFAVNVPPVEQVTSESLLAPLAIDPTILGKLQNNQLIDDDRVMQYKMVVSYIGPDKQGKNVVVVSQVSALGAENPRVDSVYDSATGLMIEQDKTNPTINVVQRLQLAAQNQ